ncbi:MAG: hypothetical protein ABS880_06490, partial [Psychrobacter alimentarius]
EKIGTQIQAIGNTVVASSYILFEDELESKLVIKGNCQIAVKALEYALFSTILFSQTPNQ